MKKSITIRDVARAAGVSRQTVSRAFNDKGEISPETKRHVLEVAEKLGYRPSHLARSLSINRTNNVGIIVPDITYPFFARIVKGAEEVSFSAGYNLFLINTYVDGKKEIDALDSLWDRRVDGAILYGSLLPDDKLGAYVERLKYTVLINCAVKDTTNDTLATITVDDQMGAYKAVEKFIQLGRKNIAFLNGPRFSRSADLRLKGYQKCLQDHGIPVDDDIVLQDHYSIEHSYKSASSLIQIKPEIDAILAYNDDVALGTLNACLDNGRTVPREIAIIGFDDSPLAAAVRPSLSSIRIGKRDLGRLAMTTLIAMIEGQSGISRNQIIEPNLILRNST
jgi:LacI family transcriptional regulator